MMPPEMAHVTLMRELGIRGCTPNASKRTTVPGSGADGRPDLVGRDFESPVPTYKLVGDITYLRTGEGWLFLSTVIDLNTRMVVGWALSERMTADIVASALEAARSRGYVAEGAIFHSDRGAQYTSRLVAEWAAAHGVRLSVGRTGSCHDNAVAESFFATLKNEMYHRRSFPTRAEARRAVVGFIEGYYNRRRPHSTIGYRIPAQVMEEFFEKCTRAAARGAAPGGVRSSTFRVRNLDTGQPSTAAPPSPSCGASRSPKASTSRKPSRPWMPIPCPGFPQPAPSPKACSPPTAQPSDCSGSRARRTNPKPTSHSTRQRRALLHPRSPQASRPSPLLATAKHAKKARWQGRPLHERALSRAEEAPARPLRPSPSAPPKTSSAAPSTSSSLAAS